MNCVGPGELDCSEGTFVNGKKVDKKPNVSHMILYEQIGYRIIDGKKESYIQKQYIEICPKDWYLNNFWCI